MGFYSSYDVNDSRPKSQTGEDFAVFVDFFFKKILGTNIEPIFVSQWGEGCCNWWSTHLQYEEAGKPYRRITFISQDCDKNHNNNLIDALGVERIANGQRRVSEKPRVVCEKSGNVTVYFDEFLKPEEQGWALEGYWEDSAKRIDGQVNKMDQETKQYIDDKIADLKQYVEKLVGFELDVENNVKYIVGKMPKDPAVRKENGKFP